MNDIKLTVELCAEDRARLDKIIEGLAAIGKHPDCSKCVKDAAGLMDKACDCIDKASKAPTEPKEMDDVQKALAEVVNGGKKTDPVEAPKNAQDEPKASDHPTLDPFPEAPAVKAEASEAAPWEEKVTVSTAELQQLVIALCRAGKKDKVREIVSTYGVQTVAAIPEGKRSEVFSKMKALEG